MKGKASFTCSTPSGFVVGLFALGWRRHLARVWVHPVSCGPDIIGREYQGPLWHRLMVWLLWAVDVRGFRTDTHYTLSDTRYIHMG